MSKTVQFTDTSTNANTYYWQFGDGNTSGDRNPIHTYEEYGDYVVILTITDNNGNSDEFQQNVSLSLPNVDEPPVDETTEEETTEETTDEETSYEDDTEETTTTTTEETQEWPDFLKQQGILNLDMLYESQFYQYTATDYEDMIDNGMITLEQANIILTLFLKPTITYGGNQGGSTNPKVYGCTDPNATNYNSLANEDDGSCTYPAVYSYNLNGKLNNRQYNTINNTTSLDIMLNTVNNTGLISQIQNYVNVTKAIKINGSLSTITNFLYNSSDNSGRITIQGNMGNNAASDVNPTTAYNFEMSIESDTELNMNWSGDTSGNTGGDTGEDDGIRGCTDPQADNFNRFATIDDGSCEYSSGY